MKVYKYGLGNSLLITRQLYEQVAFLGTETANLRQQCDAGATSETNNEESATVLPHQKLYPYLLQSN